MHKSAEQKKTIRYASSVTAFLCILLPSLSWAASDSPSEMNLVFLPESIIKIDGDSTARKFSASASPVDLTGTAKAMRESNGILPWAPFKLEMTLPTKDLTSGERTLDNHMQEALKAKQFPTIQLKLSTFSVPTKTGDAAGTITASGTLTVAGVPKAVELKSTITAEGQNFRIKGTKRVLMSDFGITPPTLMMGTLKTHDEIDITYNVVCSKSDKKVASK